MAIQTISLIAVCGLILLVLFFSFVRFQRGHGPRSILRGLGISLTLAGGWLSGFADLLSEGIRSLCDWVRTRTLDNAMIMSVSLVGVGLVLFCAGTMIRSRSKEERHAARLAPGEPVAAVAASADRHASSTAASPHPSTKQVLSDEDAEIEALLRARGIE